MLALAVPGAYGRMSLFGVGPLLLAAAGLLLIGLLKTPFALERSPRDCACRDLGSLWAAARRADRQRWRRFAVRGADGRLAIHHAGGDSFAVREWLAADADGRDVHDQSLGQGIACDPSGCIGKLAAGGLVSYALSPEAYEEDCAHAALVVATRGEPPADCKAKVIARALWRDRGALTLHRRGSDFIIESARPNNFDRPWAPNWASALVARENSLGGSGKAKADNRTLDATPRQEDIEADE